MHLYLYDVISDITDRLIELDMFLKTIVLKVTKILDPNKSSAKHAFQNAVAMAISDSINYHITKLPNKFEEKCYDMEGLSS